MGHSLLSIISYLRIHYLNCKYSSVVGHLPTMFKGLGFIFSIVYDSKPKLNILLLDSNNGNIHCITFGKINLDIKMYGKMSVRFSSKIIHHLGRYQLICEFFLKIPFIVRWPLLGEHSNLN